ncbi:methylenetetrahydrofolate reductase [Rhizorhapis suberifaciens]|uniref:Methylenetetrahydrofolate reductase n=1 Tax=Rhizorhapis suberifaciens TaxID=13656 RepID=A0A840HVV2_9SPHN|nr:methylenetetrahydrofolate reductase [Rhizorhapis suberifaciens]MBB4641668.1 methylenetetrahydrofolate reductase (NADPH) [Rhizorhapis suberifaciens]
MSTSVVTIVPENASAMRLMDDYSIEITVKDGSELAKAAPLMAPNTRISVTFLPKEDYQKRLAAVAEVLRLGLRPVPHISARRIKSEVELETYLSELAKLGASEELFIVAGDPDVPDGPFEDALTVIRSGLLQKYGVRRIGIGGYPEGHSKIGDDQLWQALRDKHAALTEQGIGVSILTQFGFNTEPVFAWLKQLRSEGIDAPVRLGVPGPASATTLLRFAARCGVSASSSVLSKYGLSLTKLMQPTGPDKYVLALAKGMRSDIYGDVGLHFYPFGGLIATAAWIRAFSAIGEL